MTLYTQLMDVEKDFSLVLDRIHRFKEVRREQLGGMRIRKYPTKKSEYIRERITQIDAEHQEQVDTEFAYIQTVFNQALRDKNRHILHRFRQHEENPILKDAINSRQSINESLEELASKHKGAKRLLPRRKDSAYNQRVEQMEELISTGADLKTRGFFAPDNFVTAAAYGYALLSGFSFIAPHFMALMSENPGPEEMETYRLTGEVLRTFIGPPVSLLIGLGLQRSTNPNYNQAQTIDEYIEALK